MYKKIIAVVFILTLVLTSAACQQTAQPGKVYPTPQAGRATVGGRLLSLEGKPYVDIIVRLAEVYENEVGDRAFALDLAFSPIAFTDTDGYFVFENIEPREYVFIVGDPMARYLIPTEETDKPKAWNFGPDTVTDMGDVKVDFDLE